MASVLSLLAALGVAWVPTATFQHFPRLVLEAKAKPDAKRGLGRPEGQSHCPRAQQGTCGRFEFQDGPARRLVADQDGKPPISQARVRARYCREPGRDDGDLLDRH